MHSCTFSQNSTAFKLLKLHTNSRHDPKDLLDIDSSSPYSTVTDSMQTRKQEKTLLQMIDQESTHLLKG